MKRISVFFLGTTLFLIGTISLSAQGIPKKMDKVEAESFEDDEGPIMFKFEPDYLSARAKRCEEMAQTKRILDTLEISENKRKKLLKDLYKNGLTKRLSKALFVENKYEDTEE